MMMKDQMDKVWLPEAFRQRMKEQLGSEYPVFETELLSGKKTRGLRVNTEKISVEEYLKITPHPLEKIPYTKDGFYLLSDRQMGFDAGRHAGMFYLQDPSAMLPVNAIEVKPGQKALDLCASPGGKTSQLSNAVGETGLVVANDIREARVCRLNETVSRLGLKNTIVTMASARDLCSRFSGFFDIVLVDAPCSCEGMFRKKPKDIGYWSPEHVRECAAIQKGLLEEAASTVAANGALVYSTCTFSEEENEMVVEWFLNRFPSFRLIDPKDAAMRATSHGIPVSKKLPKEKLRRFYPHRGRGEGQFVAVMRQTGTVSASGASFPVCPSDGTAQKERDIVRVFLERTGIAVSEERILVRDGNAWILPRVIAMPEGVTQQPGVYIGQISKGELLPDHGFFSTYGSCFTNRLDLELEDPRVSRYLRGEDLQESFPDGWGAVTIAGCAAGGFRSDGHTLVNLYPEILRNWT